MLIAGTDIFKHSALKKADKKPQSPIRVILLFYFILFIW